MLTKIGNFNFRVLDSMNISVESRDCVVHHKITYRVSLYAKLVDGIYMMLPTSDNYFSRVGDFREVSHSAQNNILKTLQPIVQEWAKNNADEFIDAKHRVLSGNVRITQSQIESLKSDLGARELLLQMELLELDKFECKYARFHFLKIKK